MALKFPFAILNLESKGTASKISLSTVSDSEYQQSGTRVDFKISSEEGSGNNHVIHVNSAWAVKELNIPLKHRRVFDGTDRWLRLKEIPFPDVERKKVSALLGTSVQEALVPLEVREGEPHEPIAIRSSRGWSVFGGAPTRGSPRRGNDNYVDVDGRTLENQLESFWKVESCGTEKVETKLMSLEDRRALDITNKTMYKDGDHYSMGLL